MHYGKINSLAMCAWKPIFMTSGEQDKSIRIWNYMTDDVEMIKLYQEEIHCVSLHPTGTNLTIALSTMGSHTMGLVEPYTGIKN